MPTEGIPMPHFFRGAWRRLAASTVAGCALLAASACAKSDRQGSAPPETAASSDSTAAASTVSCAPGNGGISLPAGFCATVFADSVGGPRHVVIASNGDVFVAVQTAPSPVEKGAAPTGGILALRDTNRDGRADLRETFGELGGTGIGLHDGYLYADAKTAIVRYRLAAGSLRPTGGPDTIVAGMPTGGHAARNFVIDRGALYVNFGSRSNSCQVKDRQKQSPGHDPCTELDQRAGVWRFDAARTRQTPTIDQRFATGIRNAVGLAVNPTDGALYATQHGRDQLYQNWPERYTPQRSAEQPREQLMRLSEGDDYGWPYCYFDGEQNRLVLAPEYGGDGRQVGRCAQKKAPLAHYPGHWAPNALAFYNGTQFPARYRGGAFIAFHGSWNRAPEPQGGYNVVFQPMANGQPSGAHETFADGFAGGRLQPDDARHRPSGLAFAPDGALFITDDQAGRIWRVVYQGTARSGTRAAARTPRTRLAGR
jgi:glucose/arabinose dehydrogenase